MPSRYQNTFRPNTPTGQTMQTLAQALFGGQVTPREQSRMDYYEAGAMERAAQADKARTEAQGMRQRIDMRTDPQHIAGTVATRVGVPQRDVQQYQEFIRQGTPIARPGFEPEIARAVRENLAAYQSMPMMTGDTNYQQFMEGVDTGMTDQRMRGVEGGQTDPREFARLQGAREGEPMVDIKQGYMYDPYGQPGEYEQLPIAAALANQRNTAAAENLQDAAGGGAPDYENVATSDLDFMDEHINTMLAEADMGSIDTESYTNIMARAAQLFRDPSSPAAGNQAEAAAMAVREARQQQQVGAVEPSMGDYLMNLVGFGAEPEVSVPSLTGTGQPTALAPQPTRQAPAPREVEAEGWMEQLPDPSSLPEGQMAEDENGRRYIVKGGQWLPMDS